MENRNKTLLNIVMFLIFQIVLIIVIMFYTQEIISFLDLVF